MAEDFKLSPCGILVFTVFIIKRPIPGPSPSPSGGHGAAVCFSWETPLVLTCSLALVASARAQLAFGVRKRERKMLFARLPLLAADMSICREMGGGVRGGLKVEDTGARCSLASGWHRPGNHGGAARRPVKSMKCECRRGSRSLSRDGRGPRVQGAYFWPGPAAATIESSRPLIQYVSFLLAAFLVRRLAGRANEGSDWSNSNCTLP